MHIFNLFCSTLLFSFLILVEAFFQRQSLTKFYFIGSQHKFTLNYKSDIHWCHSTLASSCILHQQGQRHLSSTDGHAQTDNCRGTHRRCFGSFSLIILTNYPYQLSLPIPFALAAIYERGSGKQYTDGQTDGRCRGTQLVYYLT